MELRRVGRRPIAGRRNRVVDRCGALEISARLDVGLQQHLDPPSQGRVAGAGLLEIGRPLGRV